jgi:hypothetical protein
MRAIEFDDHFPASLAMALAAIYQVPGTREFA